MNDAAIEKYWIAKVCECVNVAVYVSGNKLTCVS